MKLRAWMLARRSDAGIAMITVIVAVMVLTALGATAATLGINNLTNANRDRQAGSALGAADAGVAQAIEYLRNNGVAGLTCPDANPSSCASVAAGWGSPTSPQTVALDSAGTGCSTTAAFKNCATVYITYVTKFAPPTVRTGIYAVHSLGRYGPGPGARAVVVNVAVTPDKFPVGVFGQTVQGNGGPQLYTESLFTTGCVQPLDDGHGNGTRFVGTVDPYYDQPPAAHSTVGLSTTNNSTCSSNDNGLVPSSGSCSNSSLMWDQGPTGGLLSSSSPCYRAYQRTDGSYYPDGTCPNNPPAIDVQPSGLCDTNAFTTQDLNRYGYRPRGLTDAQYSELKARSQSQGLYNLTGSVTTALNSALSAGITNPVLYWDCSVAAAACSSGVTLKQSDIPSTFTAAAGTCSNLHILTVVVEHANLTLSGGNSTTVDAAVFAPDGTYNNNGAVTLYGTLFSKTLDITSSPVFRLDSCWTSSFPGPVLSVTQKTFREDDTKDLS